MKATAREWIEKAEADFVSGLTVRGKSHPWPFSTWATPENAEGFRGYESPPPAAADCFHSLLREYRARKRPNFDAACFFAQQCIEKYLKGRLADADRPIPKTHDLSVLLDAVVALEPLWETARPRLETLTSYAVLFRYPGESATKPLAKTAVDDLKWVRELMRKTMRLRGR